MARRYFRRSYRRAYPRKKWASNIGSSTLQLTVPANSSYAAGAAFALNPAQSPSTVASAFTVKRVRLSIDAVTPQSEDFRLLQQVIAAIMYVPQGYTVDYTILQQHPEWIMAIKYMGEPSMYESPTSTGGTRNKPFQVSSRLARKLQTGDSIQLVLFATNISTDTAANINFRFLAQWWSRSD